MKEKNSNNEYLNASAKHQKIIEQHYKSTIKRIKYFVLGCCIAVGMYYFGLLGFNILQASFYEKGFPYKISGTVLNNHSNAGVMYMAYNESDSPFDNFWVIDSAKIVNDKFEFEGSTYYPAQTYISTDMNSLYYRSVEKTSVLYIEPKEEITCVIDLEHPFYNIKVYNSPTFDDYRYMVESMRPLDERRADMWHKIDSVKNIGDTAQIVKLNDELVKLNWDYREAYLNSAYSLNKNSAVAFDGYVGILMYNEYLTDKQLKAIEVHFENSPWYVKESKSGQRVKKMIDFNKYHPHERYGAMPDITARDQYGKNISIRSLNGKYDVILYTFGMNTNDKYKDLERLKELYESRPEGSLKIITLCIGGKTSEWKEEILKYGHPDWVQLQTRFVTRDAIYLADNYPSSIRLFNRWGDEWHSSYNYRGGSKKNIAELNKCLKWREKINGNSY